MMGCEKQLHFISRIYAAFLALPAFSILVLFIVCSLGFMICIPIVFFSKWLINKNMQLANRLAGGE